MRRAAILAALAALAAASAAFAAHPPDTVTRGHAVYARRGALGADDYVATNVAPCASAYVMSRVSEGRLRDRAANVLSVTNDVALALPARRTVAGFARSFVLYLKVDADGPCRLTLTGAGRLLAADGFGGLSYRRGEYVLTFFELDTDVYMVSSDELAEVETEGE